MIDFSDLHFIFWLFILALCIVYNLTMNSEFENVRKNVLNSQSFFFKSHRQELTLKYYSIFAMLLNPKTSLADRKIELFKNVVEMVEDH